MSGAAERNTFDHLRERYSAHRVMHVFGISRATLHRWIAEGLIRPVRISARKIEFEIDEVERRYRACRGDE